MLHDRILASPGPFGSNTGSDLTWQLVDSWMAKCLSSHQACNKAQPLVPPLPTRVIDVGTRGGTRAPRLHVTTNNAIGRYTTLSHRWAYEEPLRLQVNNLEDFQREIPISRLTRTFQDAIEATRRLGIQYIWIDSLCIIQDSPAGRDWAAESAKMASVYENSYVNFAATHAMDSSQGCFFDRKLSQVRPVRLYVNWEVRSGFYHTAQSHSFPRSVAGAPLYKRGWVYQERALAPRIIHCTDTQVYWECLESIASESFPTGLPHAIHSSNTDCQCRTWRRLRPPASSILERLSPQNSTSDTFYDSLRLWNLVVNQYQTLDLTFERDKLVAISGLAKLHSKFLDTQYLAGMWRAHLAEQLLWVRRMGCRPCSYRGYIAPSWSWASIPTPVWLTIRGEENFPGIAGLRMQRSGEGNPRHFRPLIEVLDVTMDLLDENHPFGAVSKGALRIKGPLAKFSRKWDLAFHGSRQLIHEDRLMVGSYVLDRVNDPWELPKRKGRRKSLYFLVAMLHWSTVGRDENKVAGLLLEKTHRGGDVFQRIGVFDLYSNIPRWYMHQDGDGVRLFQKACRSQNGTDDDGPFPEWGKQQVVTII